MEGRRIFAAIDISDEARDRVCGHNDFLKHEFPTLRVGWERREKLHITVKFAGSLNGIELSEFAAKADEAARSCPPFAVTIANTGAFIRRGGTNVLWLGLDGRQIGLLAAAFELADESNKRKRAFSPHLTIARLREPQNSRTLIDRHLSAKFGPVEFIAREIVIYESTLLPHGSVYRAVSLHRFTGEE